jgi:hypothetical protein
MLHCSERVSKLYFLGWLHRFTDRPPLKQAKDQGANEVPGPHSRAEGPGPIGCPVARAAWNSVTAGDHHLKRRRNEFIAS